MLSWTRRSRPQWTPALVLQVLLLVVLILVRAEPGAATNSTEASVISSYLPDTNLYGRDYRSFDVSGQLLCRNACLEEARCKAWTYVRPDIQGPIGKCWLKESVPTETADTCCISGVKKTISDDEETVSQVTAPNPDGSTSTFLKNTILYGQDYSSVETSSPFQCRNACLQDDRCRAWTFARPGNQRAGTCRLKNGVPSQTAHTCCVSGVKAAANVLADTPKKAVDTHIETAVHPHVYVGGLEVIFARDRGPGHRPIDATKEFKDTDKSIFVIFRNTGSAPIRATIDTYALNVDGMETDAQPWRPISVLVQPGQRASYQINAPDGGFRPGTYSLAISAGESRWNVPIEIEPQPGSLAKKSPSQQTPKKSEAPSGGRKKTAKDHKRDKVRSTVDRGPHMFVSGLQVTIAKSVSWDHRPLNPGRTFDEDDRTIFLAFENAGSNFVQATVDVFAVDVEGIQPNSAYWRNAWVSVPSGQRSSLRLNGPESGLVPGEYRVEVRAGGSRRTAMVEVVPENPYALREDEADIEPGPNIALAALGGRIERASQWDDESWSKHHINDGVTWARDPSDPNRCMICGWASRNGDTRPSIVLSFHQGREAAIGAVVVDTRRFWIPGRNYVQYSAGFPKNVAILVSSESASRGFERVATARLRRNAERQIIPLPEGVRAKYLKLEVLENFGAHAVGLGELEVIEANSREESILHDAEIDIANAGLGGALVRYTGYRGQSAAYLFDADDRGTSWRSVGTYFPQDFTIAFKDDQVALVDRVRLTLSQNDDPPTWPSQVAIALSQESPLDGFVEIARFPVEKRAGAQEIAIRQKARFVKVRLLDNHGGQHTTLSEIAVIEGEADGYTPVLLREGLADDQSVSEVSEELADEDTISEVEPNNDLGTAGSLSLDRTLRGNIDPLGELDFFGLPELGADARALTLNYAGRPYIRHGLSLLDGSGGVISHFNPGDLPASDAKLTFALKGNERYLKLSEPPASVVVIWDTSGSMQGSEGDLESAVRQYIRRAPPSQRMNLVRFSDDVEVLLPRFTSDKTRLLNAAGGKFSPKGGTRLYDAVLKGMELLADVQGNRAIVMMTDGADNGQTWHGKFWGEVADNRIRLYTIGLGQELANYSYAFATSGQRILRHLARGTDGDAFFATESADLQDFYGRIADELSRPATYLLTPMVERGEGTLRLVATGEQVPGAARPAVHMIYDLSGSMREPGPGGKPKFQLARAAVYTTLDGLDDGTPFGFTVYGARIPERAGKERACKDILTLQELAPLNKKVVKDFVAKQRPKGGTTPLADSIRHVAEKLRDKKGAIIIVVTDGKEECDPNLVATVETLKPRELQHLELSVIGFVLKDSDARDMMQEIAEIGGGRYYDAADGDALAHALRQAMAAKYTVRDATDRVVASGTIDGGDVPVPAGLYRVDIAAAGAPIRTRNVRINAEHVTTVSVNKVGSEVDVVVSPPQSLAAIREARRTCGAAAAEFDADRRAARIQAKLNKLGFDAGPADNRPGPKTHRAVAAFAKKYGLAEDLPIDLLLEQHLDCAITIGSTYLTAN